MASGSKPSNKIKASGKNQPFSSSQGKQQNVPTPSWIPNPEFVVPEQQSNYPYQGYPPGFNPNMHQFFQNPFTNPTPFTSMNYGMSPPLGSSTSSVGNTTQFVGSSQSPNVEPETQIPIESWMSDEEMASQSSRKSGVWKHFKLSREKDKAKCKACGKILTAKSTSGTGHLKRHAEKCILNSDPSQPKLTQYHQAGVGPFHYNYEKDKDALSKMLVQAEKPFLFAENDNFNQYINFALQPQHRKVSRKQAKSSAMRQYLTHKQQLIAELSNLDGKVSITADCWDSGVSALHYLCVTVHWIDANWIMQKRIISFRPLEYPHNAVNIANMIMTCIEQFGLKNKILSMTFDNASSMTASARMLGQNLEDLVLDGSALHVRCACHVLNLCVQDGVRAINVYYHKIREACNYINMSGMRKQEWKHYLQSQRIPVRKIPVDVVHRWNSSYELLKVAIDYKVPITEFFNSRCPNFALLDSDWEKCEKYLELLNLFYDSTKLFSTVYSPTSHTFVVNAALIAQLFHKYRNSREFDDFLLPMEEKFKKYYENLPPIFVFASFLDPRQKFETTCQYVECYVKFLELPIDYEEYKKELCDSFFELYSYYDNRFGEIRNAPNKTSKDSGSGKIISNVFAKGSNLLGINKGKGKSNMRTTTSSDMSEFQMFLNYDFMRGESEETMNDLDLLHWWQKQSKQFPVLSAMARDIYAVQVSSVASERAFSASGRVLDDRRTRLKPDTLEMCICFKDWLDANKRSQDHEEYDDDSNESTMSTTTSVKSLVNELEGEDDDGDEQNEEDDDED